MLIPLRPGELQRLIPAVATGSQFRAALGSPREILKRVMVAAIGDARQGGDAARPAGSVRARGATCRRARWM